MTNGGKGGGSKIGQKSVKCILLAPNVLDFRPLELLEVLRKSTKRLWTEQFPGKVFETPGVNFINVKCTNFSYEHYFGSFYYVQVTRKKLPKQRSYEKFAL